MPPATRKRSTRDRPAKAPLSLDAIVDAALELLKTEGLEAVTMRRVASALDTGPASLYVYVAKREDLLRAMQDRIVATVALEPPDPERWREQLHALLARMHQALVAHPGIAATTLAEPLTTEATLRFLENMLGILLAGSIDPQDAAWAADIFTTLVTHAAIEGDVRRSDRREDADAIRETFAALPPDRFPLVTTHANRLVAGDSQQRLRVAIDVVIDGLLARAR
ncbi:TetR/AcrR family transcriptional regulator [Streptomyces sp. enrichment culture]|uniref:TetR/AcrR family transcriptional regulator n=1 Tax=Streptomyces sp. enrichment culture TaxID=1795815 RepID=UPI003F57FA0D